ncbi:MAG: GAF domain-containing protein, partial [Candidatus Dormibacteria bacterium]
MAESFDPRVLAADKVERYGELAQEIGAVVAGEADIIARMAGVAAMLKASFATFFWVGFYRLDPANPRELVIGPYQGSLGCLRIALGEGVCGTAAERRETIMVADVEAFAGHIACDPRSKSEIVVPVFDSRSVLIGVLAVDSDRADAFDARDRAGLE